MEDDELQAIRAKRLAEMQAKNGGAANTKEDAEMKGQMEEQRRSMLHQILEDSARERLGRIQMLKPDKVRQIEEQLIRMARANQLRSKVTEKQIIDLLQSQSEGEGEKNRIVIQRKRYDDSDDDDY